MTQKPKSDPKKLKSMLESVSDQEKIRILNELAGSYYELPPKDRMAFAEQAGELSKRFCDPKSEAEAYNHLGVAYNNIGNSHESVKYFLKALRIMEQIDDQDGIADSHVNLGQANFYLDDFDKALEYFQKALDVRKKIGGKPDISQALILVGNVMAKMARYDEALDYYFKALILKEEIDDKIGISQIQNNLGNVYFAIKEPEKALKYRLKALQIDRELGNEWEIANTAFNIAEGYLQVKQPEKAYPYILESQKIANELQNEGLLRDNLHNLSLYHELRGEYQEALNYQREYSEATKTLFAKELREKIAEMQIQYGTEKLEEMVAEQTRELRETLTGRIQMEDALRKSEVMHRLLFDNLGDAVFIASRDGRILAANPAASQQTGYSHEELIGMNIIGDLTTAEPEITREKGAKRLAREETLFFEEEKHRKDGTTYISECVVTKIEYDGQPGNLSVNRDITKRVQAEEAVRLSFSQLAEATSRAMETQDPYTVGHQRQVAELAKEVGEKMGLDQDRLSGLYIGGLLHDIGKIAVPSEILTQPGKLSEVEWGIIRSHPRRGYEILKETDFPWPVADMTLHHHERLDGSGYPDGLKDGKLSLEVRILGVCDVVDAMSSDRPYRAARPKEMVIEELLSDRGTRYDEKVVDIMLGILEDGTAKG